METHSFELDLDTWHKSMGLNSTPDNSRSNSQLVRTSAGVAGNEKTLPAMPNVTMNQQAALGNSRSNNVLLFE